MIDPETGILAFDDPPVRIGPALTRAAFLAAAWAKGAADSVVNEPWRSWKLPGRYASAAVPFIVSLYFKGEVLTGVTLMHDDPQFGTSWDDWSREKELARDASHARWLDACLGDRRSFHWGSVSSGCDDRGAFSSIQVSYGNR